MAKKTKKTATPLPLWEQYVEDVLSGKQIVGKFVRMACQRHRDNMLASISDEKYPFRFDEDAAAKVCEFFNYCHHSKDGGIAKAGEPIKLEPWQTFILASVFGWMRKADNTRRFREAYVKVGRGNGKTTLLAGLGLYGLIADGEGGPEIYCFATKEDQAAELWNEAVRMRNKSPELADAIQKSHKALYVEGTAGKFMPLGSDSQTQDGKRPHFGLCDELHAHPNRSMYDVIKSGMGTRKQPLMFTITTAGFAKNSFCRSLEEMGEKILQKILEDETFFFYIASINYDPTHKEEGERDANGELYNDDYEKPENWIKSNPNLHVSVNMDFLEAQLRTAQNDPSSLNNFLTKYMDLWVSQVNRWMPMDKWARCANLTTQGDAHAWRMAKMNELKGRECYAGLDLSEKIDVTAFVLYFPPKEPSKIWTVLPWFWIPKDTMLERAKTDKVPYDVWERGGFVTATDGNVVDYDFIHTAILQLRNHFRMTEIGYDPWNATDFTNRLKNEGATTIEISQSTKNLSEATKDLMVKVVSQTVEHGNNPLLTWMASNVAVYTDPNGNIKPDKQKSAERIDGIAALVMAASRAVAVDSIKKAKPQIFVL